MNNHCYRVIFSKAKGMLIVVSEATRSQGKSSNASISGSESNSPQAGSQTSGYSNQYYNKFKTISASILLTLGSATIITPAQANLQTNSQIIADKTAPKTQQATILKTANGTPQINIQTPSSAGVSRNVYRQFDIKQNNAILNNSRTHNKTQLAGWIEGNPWLAKGSAKVILNEINSTNPSHLNGYIEIAGQKADLIIANPAGIQIQGGGFINSNRTTLTTGKPTLNNDGSIQGFHINSGKLQIKGKGLNDLDSNYTQLISKTAQINANIHSKKVDIIVGDNNVSYTDNPTDTQITQHKKSNKPANNQPTGVALDISKLGGMYAGKIRLIGTNKGMGVTNAGTIHATNLSLDANGNLINSGSITSANNNHINVNQHNINNTGTIASSTNNISIDSNTLTNSGLINAAKQSKLAASTSINNQGRISAGVLDIDSKTLNNTGRIEQTGTGKLQVNTATLTNTNQAVIGQSLYQDQPTAKTIDLNNAPSTANNGSTQKINQQQTTNHNQQPTNPTKILPPVNSNGSITVNSLSNHSKDAIITANGKMDISANQTSNTAKASIAVNSLSLQNQIDNRQTANKVINTGSRIQLNEKIDWDVKSLSNNQGHITTQKDITINAQGEIDNRQGKLLTAADINLSTDKDINNNAGIIQGKQTKLSTNKLDNNKGNLHATGTLSLDANGNITNKDGSIRSADKLSIHSNKLTNTGQIYSGSSADINSTDSINNSGLIASRADNNLSANNISNQGQHAKLVAGMKADGSLTNHKAKLSITGKDSLTSNGQHIATGTVSFQSANSDLTDSRTQAGTIKLQSNKDISTAHAKLSATDSLTLATKASINNQGGTLSAKALNLSAASLDNSKGSISQTGTTALSLNLKEGIDNTQGKIQTNADSLNIDTNELNNSKGRIVHAGNKELTIDADNINNHQGQVLSLAKQTWTAAESINNTNGVIQAKRFDISAESLDNSSGRLLAIDNKNTKKNTTDKPNQLTISNSLTNNQGKIDATTGGLTVKADTLNNDTGLIKANDKLSLNTKQLINTGNIYSAAATTINNQAKLTNSGSIAAQGNTKINTGSLTQTAKGQLLAGLQPSGKLADTDNKLTVSSTGKISNAGMNLASGDVTLAGAHVDLTNSKTQGDNITLTANTSDVILNKAQTTAHKKMTISADTLSNNQGKLQADNYQLDINKLSNIKGKVVQSGNRALDITANQGINNAQGTIATASALTIDSHQAFNNSQGTINANALKIATNSIDNKSGIISGSEVNLNANTDINNTAGLIAQTDGTKTLDISAALINNQATKVDTKNANQQTGILANGSANIKADSLNNLSGLISANAFALLIKGTNQTNNSQGQISANGNLTLSANKSKLNNQAGRTTANNSLIKTKAIDNNTANSLIQANNELNITTGKLNNQNTKQDNDNTQGIIAGNKATLNTKSLNNKKGQVLSGNELAIHANQVINNDQGNLLSSQKLDLTADNYSNNKGTISSDSVSIDSKQAITHDSNSTLSANNLTLTTQGEFDNTDKLQAQNLTITADNINNAKDAQLVSSKKTQLTATKTLDNRGLINGSDTFIKAGSATNHSFGRIYGDHLAIKADTLNNSPDTNIIKTEITKEECEAIKNCSIEYEAVLPTERPKIELDTESYEVLGSGSNPSTEWIDAHTTYNKSYYKVESDRAPVIAARERLDLGVNSLNNEANLARANKFNADFSGQASIVSNGELHIGGDLDKNHQATGQAKIVNNNGATIQSAGEMHISTDMLNNSNANFKKITTIESQQDISKWRFRTDNKNRFWTPNELYKHRWDYYVSETGEKLGEDYFDHDYTETITNKKVTASDPSRIISGRGIRLTGKNLVNDKSFLLVGNKHKVTGDHYYQLGNDDLTAQKILLHEGSYQLKTVESHALGSKKSLDNNGPRVYYVTSPKVLNTYKLPILNADINKIATGVTAEGTNIQPLQSALNQLKGLTKDVKTAKDSKLDTLQTLLNKDSTLTDAQKQDLQTILTAKASGKAIPKASVNNLINALNQKINGRQQIRTTNSMATLPNNSLYVINPDSQANYLVETDANFTNLKNWLSSDYMLKQLDTDPNNLHKRLGDGYYEQQLINNQIMALTGRYYLGDYNNQDQQYKALMDAGILVAKTLNLRPGIALTDKQAAQLSTDIVWLVEQPITLNDGSTQTVLVPKVYTRQAANNIDGTGNLIAAKNIDMQLTGHLDNSGQIVAHKRLNIDTGSVNNRHGGIIQGDLVAINTEQDLNNLGASINAGSAMQLDIGGNLNNSSSTYHTKSAQGNSSSERRDINQIASIYVGDALINQSDANGKPLTTFIANVAGDVNFNAGKLTNKGGKTLINAKGDANLNAINTHYQTNAIADSNNYYQQGQSVDVGSHMSGKGDIVLQANNISGKEATIQSTAGNTIVTAQNDVNFTDGRHQTQVDSAHSYKDKKWYGSKKHQVQQSSYSDKTLTSNITGNNVTINAKQGNIGLTGTNVNANAGKAQISALKGNINIASAVDTDASSYSHSTKNFYKETAQQQGHQNERLTRTGVRGNSVLINGKNLTVKGANLSATNGTLQVGDATLATDQAGNLILDEQGKPIVKTGSLNNADFSTIALNSKDWDKSQKSYRGIAKVAAQTVGVVAGALNIGNGITVSKSHSNEKQQHKAASTNLKGNDILIGAKQINTNGTQINTTAKGGSTYLLANDINLNTAKTTTTNKETQQKEVITGEGIKLKKDSLQISAVVNTDTTDSTTTEINTHQGSTINSDNITAIANNQLNTVAAALNANPKTGNLTLGGETINLGGIEDSISTTNNQQTETTKIGASVSHTAVQAVSAAEQLKEATQAVADAKRALSEAKDKYHQGKLSKDALKDYQANLAAAGVNLANAQIQLGATGLSALSSSFTGGFTANIDGERSQSQSNHITTTGKWQGTHTQAANTTFVGDNLNAQGSHITSKQLNLNLNKINLTAGTNSSTTSSSSSSTTQSASIGISKVPTGYGITSGNLGAGKQQSDANSQGVTYTNTQINTDKVNGNLDSLNINGGVIKAQKGNINTKHLNISTVQDTYNNTNRNKGGNIGIGIKQSLTGNIGANKGKGYQNSKLTNEQSGIIFSSDDHRLTANDTTLNGGIIANIKTDANGKQSNGTLNFTTDTLKTKDLNNHKIAEQHNIGGSIGTNEVSVQASHTGHEYESITHATIGEGAIVSSDTITANDSLAGVNRDGLNTQTVIKDIQTAGLNVDASMDSRVFTSDGRVSIKEDFKKTGMIAEAVKQVVTTDKVSMLDLDKQLKIQYKTYESIKKVIANDKELSDKLADSNLSPEVKQKIYNDVANQVMIDLGYQKTKINIMDNNQVGQAGIDIKGHYSEEDKQVYINDINIESTKDGFKTLGHELAHSQDNQDGTFEVASNDQNNYANNYGQDLAGYADFINKNYNNATLAKENNHIGNENSPTIQNNNAKFKPLDKSKGDDLTIFVHGTFSSPKAADQDFIDAIGNTYGETPVQFDWSGPGGKASKNANGSALNEIPARRTAGKRLAALISNHKFKKGEKLNVIGHSHGGNVIKEGTQHYKKGDKKIDSITFLATPHRGSHMLNHKAINKDATKVNAFDSSDVVKNVGTYDIKTYWDTSGKHTKITQDKHSNDLRGFQDVYIEVPNKFSKWHLVSPLGRYIYDETINDHSNIDSKKAWQLVREKVNEK